MAALEKVLDEGDWSRVVVAYEPVWAIGTGVTASPAQVRCYCCHGGSVGVDAACCDTYRFTPAVFQSVTDFHRLVFFLFFQFVSVLICRNIRLRFYRF